MSQPPPNPGNAIRRIAANPRLSMAVAHGGTVYLSGQVAIDSRGGPLADQGREVLRRIDDLLAAAGSDRSRLLSVNLYLRNIADLAEVNGLWEAWLAGAAPPCRTTLEARLASPDYALEISAIAGV
jgi:enamine deaminase RidA (YjgF/YER057c/UK114 family)